MRMDVLVEELREKHKEKESKKKKKLKKQKEFAIMIDNSLTTSSKLLEYIADGEFQLSLEIPLTFLGTKSFLEPCTFTILFLATEIFSILRETLSQSGNSQELVCGWNGSKKATQSPCLSTFCTIFCTICVLFSVTLVAVKRYVTSLLLSYTCASQLKRCGRHYQIPIFLYK